jgi:hypothetical protein
MQNQWIKKILNYFFDSKPFKHTQLQTNEAWLLFHAPLCTVVISCIFRFTVGCCKMQITILKIEESEFIK